MSEVTKLGGSSYCDGEAGPEVGGRGDVPNMTAMRDGIGIGVGVEWNIGNFRRDRSRGAAAMAEC